MAIPEISLRRLHPRTLPLRRREKVAFVLSGGGIFGAMQIGQIAALLDNGVTPHLVVGTSIGAINGAGLAADPTPEGIARLRETWLGLKGSEVFPGGAIRRAAKALRRGDHLLRNHGLRHVIGRIPARTFDDLRVPFYVVTTKLSTGEEQVFSKGPLAPALLASAALPGVFAPVTINGERYTDGGVVNNTPISVAIANGATKIYVISCGRTNLTSREAGRPLDVMVQAFAHSRAGRLDHDLELFRQQANIEIIPVSDPPQLRYDDLSKTAELIEQAEREARSYLAHPSRTRVRA